MPGRYLGLLLTAAAAPALAGSGPPAPVAAKTTPAQQAMQIYKANYGAVPLPAPCRRPAAGEIVVCGESGRGGSPQRLPLPDERGPRDRARTPTGEVPSALAALQVENKGNAGPHGSLNLRALAGKVLQLGNAVINPDSASEFVGKNDPPGR